MRAVSYIRVSTERQEEKYGPAAQERDIREYCKGAGLRLVGHFSDATSGDNSIEARSGLADALLELAERRADVLVVARLDRLARKLTVQEAILARVWGVGCGIHTADGGEIPQDDPDDPLKTAVRQMRGVFAQLDKAMTLARLRAGKRMKAAGGGWTGGVPPFGYQAQGGRLIPDPGEQDAVSMARRARADGSSLRQIASHLEEGGYRPRRGQRWHANSVRRLLS